MKFITKIHIREKGTSKCKTHRFAVIELNLDDLVDGQEYYSATDVDKLVVLNKNEEEKFDKQFKPGLFEEDEIIEFIADVYLSKLK